MRMLLLILIVAFNYISPGIFGQNAKDTYLHGTQLMEAGEYEEAIFEFRRLVYFEPSVYADAFVMLGDCYKNIDETDMAIYFYRLAHKKITSDSLKTEIHFRIISSYLQASKPIFAQITILNLPDDLDDQFTRKRAFYLYALHYQLQEYELSREYYYSALNMVNQPNKTIDTFFEEASRNSKFNTNLPMFLSILPGLGQLYVGEYDAALNSLLLNGAVTAIYINALGSLGYLDAFIMVLPWMHRYYQGGMLNAKRLAELKKETKDGALFNDLLHEYKSLNN